MPDAFEEVSKLHVKTEDPTIRTLAVAITELRQLSRNHLTNDEEIVAKLNSLESRVEEVERRLTFQ